MCLGRTKRSRKSSYWLLWSFHRLALRTIVKLSKAQLPR
jgi:hypothetical protein